MEHPIWCAGGHHCDWRLYRGRPAGRHRSTPLQLHTHLGTVVATRVQTYTGRDQIDLRIVVDLPFTPDTQVQDAVGRALLERVERALSEPLPARAVVAA